MVLAAEEFGGGFDPPRPEFEPLPDFLDVNGGELDPADIDSIKEQFDQVKKYLPYIVLIGITLAWKHFKKNGLDKSIDTVALSNVIAGFTPVITAFAWYMLTTVNDTAKKLSYTIAAAEVIPTIDLNLPPGINLGAYFVAADEMISSVDKAQTWLDEASKKVEDTIPWWMYATPGFQGLGVSKILRDFGFGK